MIKGKGYIEDRHLDLILCEDLVDRNNDFYNLTLGMALSELIGNEPLVYFEYDIEHSKLIHFRGWTPDKVIYNLTGFGIDDTLLEVVERNPPNE